MEIKLKHDILYGNTDLYGIFIAYKNVKGFSINDKNLKENFLSFLEEIIIEGYIKLRIYDDSLKKYRAMNCPPNKQIDFIRKIWPKHYSENNPEFDIEGLWWLEKCPIGLADIPDWARLEQELCKSKQA